MTGERGKIGAIFLRRHFQPLTSILITLMLSLKSLVENEEDENLKDTKELSAANNTPTQEGESPIPTLPSINSLPTLPFMSSPTWSSTVFDVQNESTLEEKKITVKRYHECRHCDKIFPSRSHLTRHEVVHSNEKPFACEFPGCHKTFSRSDNMKQHYVIHLRRGSKREPKRGSSIDKLYIDHE